MNQNIAIDIFNYIIGSLNNPKLSKVELIENYRKIDLIKTADMLNQIIR